MVRRWGGGGAGGGFAMARRRGGGGAGGVFALYFIGIVLFVYLLMELFSFLPIDSRYPLGLFLAVLGFFLLYRHKGPGKYLNLTEWTGGKVSRIYALDISSDIRRSQTSHDAYNPEFTYSVNDVEYVKRSGITEYGGNKFCEGQDVTVLYNPKNPDQYYVLQQHRVPILPKIVGIYWRPVGVVFLILGAGFMIVPLVHLFVK